MKANNFRVSPVIFYGEKVLEKTKDDLKQMGNKALLVTDQNMQELDYVNEIKNLLSSVNIEISIFAEVNHEPDDIYVGKGLQKFNQENCDFLIALGGGSPIDTAKAIGAMSTNPGHIRDYMGLEKIKNSTPPLVAIPTTAGTGSEVTRFTIINDSKNEVKMLIGDSNLIPDMAVINPELTVSVPPKVTAATGIDALTHAVEGYTSIKHQPLTDTLALSAIKRIYNNIEKAYNNGNNFEARSQVMLGATEAGMVINNSSVTLVHGLSRPIGALFHLPHGISNAVLLAPCMEYALEGNPERFAKIAEQMGINNNQNTSSLKIAKKGVEKIEQLCSNLNIPKNISDLRIDRQKYINNLEKMASDALESGSPDNTFKKPGKEEIIRIYKKLIS